MNYYSCVVLIGMFGSNKLISNVLWLRKLAQKFPSSNTLVCAESSTVPPPHPSAFTSIRVQDPRPPLPIRVHHPHPLPSTSRIRYLFFSFLFFFLFCFSLQAASALHPRPHALQRIRVHHQVSIYFSFLFILIRVCRQCISQPTRPHASASIR